MKDTDLMPFGKYKGLQMQEVPASYLLWYLNDSKYGMRDTRVIDYIRDNIEVLRKEEKK